MNVKLKKKCTGLGLIGWAVAIPFTLILLLILVVGFYEGRKAYWDYKVTEMCEKDGGVTVYEKVTLTQQEYRRLGGIKGSIQIPSIDNSTKDHPFFYESKSTTIREYSPKVWKSVTIIKRRSDGKPLGQSVHYSRRGGDFPTGLLHDSSYGCPDNSNLERQIFIIEGEE